MQLDITPKEARLLEALLRPRAHLLTELLKAQIEALPPGDSSWADIQDALRVTNNALLKAQIEALPPGDSSWADIQDALRVTNNALLKVRNAQLQEDRA